MKQRFLFLIRLMVSGLIALVVLSAFCLVYDNAPSGIEQPLALTNYNFKANVSWSAMTEGFGFGVTNNIGYNSADDINPEDPVIVFMGSSQTEGLQVPQDSSYVSRISAQLHSDDNPANDIACLNLGISSHYFEHCVSNLRATAEYFENARYIVIETRSLEFTEEEMDGMLTGKYYQPAGKHRPLYYLVWKVPFASSLVKQYNRFVAEKQYAYKAPYEIDTSVYAEKIEAIMVYIAAVAEEYGFEPVILYHNPIKAGNNCLAYRNDNPALREIFYESCTRNGIHLVDATDKFVAHYQDTCEMPYGFSNTSFGNGHLNVVGHRLISEAFYEKICEIPEEK